jgi:septum formation topological specificity factor MinE
MSLLQASEEKITLYQKDIIAIIAKELNVDGTQIKLSTELKETATDYWSSGRMGFSQLIAHVSESHNQSKTYPINQVLLTQLIAKHLNTDEKQLDLNLTCATPPGAHAEELNYITVTNKAPNSVLDNIRKNRENHLETTNKNKLSY